MSGVSVVDPAGPRAHGWRPLGLRRLSPTVGLGRLDGAGCVAPGAGSGVPAMVQSTSDRRDGVCEIHLREYFGSLYRKRPDASTLPTNAIMPLSGF
jgi:hypothetical protein